MLLDHQVNKINISIKFVIIVQLSEWRTCKIDVKVQILWQITLLNILAQVTPLSTDLSLNQTN